MTGNNMKYERIYNYSPVFIQNIMATVKGYQLKRLRFGKKYHQYLGLLRSIDYSNIEFMTNLQNERLRELVNYAVTNSKFYKEYYRNVDVYSIQSVSDINKLPILSKEMVRSHISEIYTIGLDEAIISNTSGTTGKPMTFYYTKEDHQKRMAYLDYFKEQHGFFHMKMRRASFNSSKIIPPNQKKPVFWRDNLAIRQRIYSGYYCQGMNIRYYVDNLIKYKPHSIDGYPSSIYQLSRYILDNNINLGFSPIAIFPTAETLLPHYRDTIEKAFRCPVRDQYASSEGAPFIIECKNGRLHYCMDTGVIEVDDECNMIVTCFETHGTPLLRYRIGDKLKFEDTNFKCECGSAMPVIKQIDGRGHEYLISANGSKFPELYLSLVSQNFHNRVKAMQFVQNRIGVIDVFLEVDDYYQDSMNEIIKHKLQYTFGSDTKVNIIIVDIINKEPSGKFRMVINNINR